MTRRLGPTHSGPALGSDCNCAPPCEELEWQLRGICRLNGNDPDLWYPEQPNLEEKSRVAKSLCTTCPVIEQCRQWALSTHQLYGVWGGMSEGDRETYWRGRRAKRRYHRREPISA